MLHRHVFAEKTGRCLRAFGLLTLCTCGPAIGTSADGEGGGETEDGSSTSSGPEPTSFTSSSTTVTETTGMTTDASTSTGLNEPYACLRFETVELPDLDGFRRWVDINGDGNTSVIAYDDVVVQPIPTTHLTRLQHEDGRVIELPGRHVRFSDIDGDGLTDAMVNPSTGTGVWVRGLASEDWFEDVPNDVHIDDDPEPELWDAMLRHVNDDAFADIVKHPDESYVQVRLGHGDGSFAPAVELPEASVNGHVVASTPGRVLVWEELPRYAWTGRYTELRFGSDLAEPAALSTELMSFFLDARGDFDGDGDTDVVAQVDGVATLMRIEEDGWTIRPLQPSTEFSTGSFDTEPGMDLLVRKGDDVVLLSGFALDREVEPVPLIYVPPQEFPDTNLWLTDPALPIVGDGIDSVVFGLGISPTIWIHGRPDMCE